MKTARMESELEAIAEQVYLDNHDTFVRDFSQDLKSRIESGLAQYKDGQYMSLGDSEAKLRKELFK